MEKNPSIGMITESDYDTEEQIIKKINQLRKTNKSQKLHDISYRKKQLQTLKSALIKYEKEIHYSNKKDLGQSEFLSIYSTYSMMLNDVDYLLANIDSWASPRSVDVPVLFAPAKSYVIPEPFGVSLIMSSWNFQYLTLIMPIAQAIAAGNCILAKPSEMATYSASVVQKILAELDQDIIQVVQGDALQCIALLKNRFDVILFTGSPQKGRLIAEAAAKFLTPCILELGGQNPTIVDSSANLENAAFNIISGRYMTCGQICLSPEYVLVEESIHAKLVEMLKITLERFYSKNPKSSEDYSRIINEFHTKRLIELINACPKQNLVCGGSYDLKEKYIEPTIYNFESISEFANVALAKDEIFGPILYVAPYKNIQEAIEYINSKDKPLVIYYFGSDSKNKSFIEKKTSSGGLVCNDCVVHFSSHYLPFGGVGKSGYSAYHGKFGFDNFSHLKPVLDRKEMLLKLRYPPYTDGKKKFLKFALFNATFSQKKLINCLLLIGALVLAYFMLPVINDRFIQFRK